MAQQEFQGRAISGINANPGRFPVTLWNAPVSSGEVCVFRKKAGVMREFTKSLMSASWAMSLLGIREGLGLFNPQAWDRSQRGGANSFEPVAQAAASQLDPSLQGLFRTGDNLQRGMVNLMFGFFDPGTWNPGRWTPGTGSTSPCGGNQSGQSWGPMPPRPNGQ